MNKGAKWVAAAILSIGATVALAPASASAAPEAGLIQPVQYYGYHGRPYYRHGYGPRFYHRPVYGYRHGYGRPFFHGPYHRSFHHY